MSADQIADLAASVHRALEGLEAVTRERDFLRRVMIQAVLSNGGEIIVDPPLAPAAHAERRPLMIGQGVISL